MASIKENYRYWEEVYDWSQRGEEWSRGWGGTQALWAASLKPRIQRFLPAQTILEIGPGHGRFTQQLSECCQTYIGVDLSPSCVEVCQELFPHASFHANDGQTLPMIDDASVDFIFSFFSLIHAEKETMKVYLKEFARKLKPEGGGFVHHSNLAHHQPYFSKVLKLPKGVRNWLFEAGLLDLPQWRAPSMSAQLFASYAEEAGLAILSQETVNFGSRRTIDAFSSFVRADGPWAANARTWHNSGFMHEAMRTRLKNDRRPAILSPEYYGPLQRQTN